MPRLATSPHNYYRAAAAAKAVANCAVEKVALIMWCTDMYVYMPYVISKRSEIPRPKSRL